MLYKFECNDFNCGRWNKTVELPFTGGKCSQCQEPLALKDDSNQLRAVITQTEALQDIAIALARLASCVSTASDDPTMPISGA